MGSLTTDTLIVFASDSEAIQGSGTPQDDADPWIASLRSQRQGG